MNQWAMAVDEDGNVFIMAPDGTCLVTGCPEVVLHPEDVFPDTDDEEETE